MAVDDGTGRAGRSPARSREVVVPFPGPGRDAAPGVLTAYLPSGRSLLVATCILLLSVGGYWVARATSLFAVEEARVTGAPSFVTKQVERALGGVEGRSLLALDLDGLEETLVALPTVREVSFDRAFPHRLEVAVVPETPAFVVRRGRNGFLVSDRGRVMRKLRSTTRSALPRIWVPKNEALAAGQLVQGGLLALVNAVGPLTKRQFPVRVAAVRLTENTLVLRLRSGLEVRLGQPRDVALKLAVAASIIRLAGDDAVYVDVSVPERPVAGTTLNSQVEVETQPSTTP